MQVKFIKKYIYLEPCRLLEVTLKLRKRRQQTLRPQKTLLRLLKTFFHLSWRLEIGPNCSKCQRPTDRQQSNSNCSRSTARTYSKRTLLFFNKIQAMLLDTYKFLLLFFKFNLLCSFLHCPKFEHFARKSPKLGGGLPLPPPLPDSYAYDKRRGSCTGSSSSSSSVLQM